MKILTLQITAKNFEAILKGKQKEETRICDSMTLLKRHYERNPDNGGWDLIKYDTLRLINGRKENAPELTVKVVDYGIEMFVDENDDEVFVEDAKTGEDIQVTRVIYHLGDVLSHKNTDKFLK